MKISKTKLAVIGSVGVPANYGGFETLAHHLVLNLSKALDITVYNSTYHYAKEERVEEWEGASIKYVPLKANGIQSVIYDIVCMIHALFFSDVLLILGVSGCLFLPILKLFSNKKVIVNVDGLEWRRAKWNGLAKQFLIFSEKITMYYADEIVTDNKAIQKYVHDRYGINSSLIEYGADHNETVAIDTLGKEKYPFILDDYAFKVARIEPENNIHLVLEAFKNTNKFPLVMVGNWNRSEYGINLKAEYANCENIYLLDPIYEPYELNMLRSNAKLYVHGHSAGGTNPSLVEAMYLGLPILSYGVIYNKITTEHKAIYFDQVSDLETSLLNFEDLKPEVVALEMEAIAQRRYQWHVISDKYRRLVVETVPQPTPVFDFELPRKLRQAF